MKYQEVKELFEKEKIMRSATWRSTKFHIKDTKIPPKLAHQLIVEFKLKKIWIGGLCYEYIKFALTPAQRDEGYIWICKECGSISKYNESICERCQGDDA